VVLLLANGHCPRGRAAASTARGTTPLGREPRLPTRSLAGCDGPDPSGSTEALPAAPPLMVRPFFRRLTGDGRVVACASKITAPPRRASTRFAAPPPRNRRCAGHIACCHGPGRPIRRTGEFIPQGGTRDPTNGRVTGRPGGLPGRVRPGQVCAGERRPDGARAGETARVDDQRVRVLRGPAQSGGAAGGRVEPAAVRGGRVAGGAVLRRPGTRGAGADRRDHPDRRARRQRRGVGEVRTHWSEEEAANLIMAIATINVWNRIAVSTRMPPARV
jgi:hypothetical protein